MIKREESFSVDNVYKSNHRKIATILSIIPGLGQIYNRQYLKGSIFLVLSAAFVIAFWDFIDIGIWGIFTLGEKLPRDNSIFLMVYGIISIFLLAIAAIIMIINLRDAYKNGKNRDMGQPLNSVRGQYQNLIDSGFPYLMLSPGFFLLLFVVILPIAFVLLHIGIASCSEMIMF